MGGLRKRLGFARSRDVNKAGSFNAKAKSLKAKANSLEAKAKAKARDQG